MPVVNTFYYLILTQRLNPIAINTMSDYLTAQPKTGIVGPRLLNADGSIQGSCYPFPTLAREFWRLLHLDKIHPVRKLLPSQLEFDATA